MNTNYIGIPIGGITTDFDGDTRHVEFPYIGADERIHFPLPITLSAFTARLNPEGPGVLLEWMTISEVNNYGFEIERRTIGPLLSEWTKIGFVQGAGTSTSPREYSFTDQALSPGRYAYRIKQIDNDGTFKYYGNAEVGTLAPSTFALDQNYPNPFNPATTIRYGLPARSVVRLAIYNVLGQVVSELANGEQDAGYYNVQWTPNAPSGIYFYRVEAVEVSNSSKRFVDVKKMLLLK